MSGTQSWTRTWTWILLWIGLSAQDKTPDVTVTCLLSQECILPCSFQPAGQEMVEWLRQDVVVYRFDSGGVDAAGGVGGGAGNGLEQLSGRASLFPQLVANGNATLVLRSSALRDRGTYSCHVRTAMTEHHANVILKVQAPIRDVQLELSRLSGYEEMKCSVRGVFPAPRVTWATDPPTFQDLRPVTRMLADKQGLFSVDSRLRLLSGKPELLYICRVSTSYGGPTWTSSLREREIKGTQGTDLTIPCSAPSYLNNPSLEWSFTDSEDDSAHILTYDSQSGSSTCTPTWEGHVELDGFRVPFGDGSLRLMDPGHAEHTGSYVCRFLSPFSVHTERTDVAIDDPQGERSSSSEKPTHLWILALVVVGLLLALAGLLIYVKLKGRAGKKPQRDPEEVTELHPVRDSAGDGRRLDISAGRSSGPQSS